MKPAVKNLLITLLGPTLLAFGCGNNPTAVSHGTVTEPYPLAVGNSWEYTLEMSVFVHEDTAQPPVTASATGYQKIEITRTEKITGDEAFGLKYYQVMGRLFQEGADTTEEVHYVARRGDLILLKANEFRYGTGGFVPLSLQENGGKSATRLIIGGRTRTIPLNYLAALLLEPSSGAFSRFSAATSQAASPASDGIQNRENVFFYDFDYVMLYNELYKGRIWKSQQAQSLGDIDVLQKVTNILDGLSGFSGPIAEVEETTSLIDTDVDPASDIKIRFYYKGNLGIVQAEIFDPQMPITGIKSDGSLEYLGIGTWQVVKKLVNYSLKSPGPGLNAIVR